MWLRRWIASGVTMVRSFLQLTSASCRRVNMVGMLAAGIARTYKIVVSSNWNCYPLLFNVCFFSEDKVCPEGLLKCPGSFCIPPQFLCNNLTDCPNGEDERNCGMCWPDKAFLYIKYLFQECSDVLVCTAVMAQWPASKCPIDAMESESVHKVMMSGSAISLVHLNASVLDWSSYVQMLNWQACLTIWLLKLANWIVPTIHCQLSIPRVLMHLFFLVSWFLWEMASLICLLEASLSFETCTS